MRVKFTADWNHIEGTTTTAYKADHEYTVKKSVGKAAIKAKRATGVPLVKEQEADGKG